jgi:signal transduction histidine kinase
MRKKRSLVQYVYLVLLAVLGSGSTLAVAAQVRISASSSVWLLLAISFAYALADYYGVSVETARPGSRFELTVTDAVVVFALFVVGPAGLLPILLGSLGARAFARGWERPLGYVFNFAHRATGYCLWLALAQLTHADGLVSAHAFPDGGWLLVLGVVYLLWDSFFFSLLISIGSQQPFVQVVRQKLTPTAWLNGIPIAMGALAAMAFTIDPSLVTLAIIPLVLAHRAMAAVARRFELTAALEHANVELAVLNNELEQRVAERTVALETALRAKDDFVSIVTHELRTPLTSILGSLGVLTDTMVETIPPRTRRMLRVAYTNSERLARLVDDLLDLQKLGARRLDIRLRRLDLTTVVEQTVEANRPYAARTNVFLCITEQAPGVSVQADADRLMQVLTNLLSNACKFSPPGAEVSIAVRGDDRVAEVSVTDRGPGIPETFRPHVFEQFAQADSSATRRHGGSGLGLSIAKGLLEAMEGTIRYDIEPQGGTTFTITLPLATACADRHERSERVGKAALDESRLPE